MSFWPPSSSTVSGTLFKFSVFDPLRLVTRRDFRSLRGEMAAANRVLQWDDLPSQSTANSATVRNPIFPEKPVVPGVPALRVMPLLKTPAPRQFVRVPTHAVGVHNEHRESPRA